MGSRELCDQRFGRWYVVSRAPDKVLASGYHEKMWNCVCDCGTAKIVRGKSLVGGISTSCGCFQREDMSRRAKKHGGFGSRLYAVWNSMRQRCNNPQHHAYSEYGGRGITICPEWDDFSAFRDWAVSNGYDEEAKRGQFTLDRIDVNAGYSPENCRWSNMRTQANNRRMTVSITHEGTTLPLTEWADRIGVKYQTLWRRYQRGLSPDKILSKSRT